MAEEHSIVRMDSLYLSIIRWWTVGCFHLFCHRLCQIPRVCFSFQSPNTFSSIRTRTLSWDIAGEMRRSSCGRRRRTGGSWLTVVSTSGGWSPRLTDWAHSQCSLHGPSLSLSGTHFAHVTRPCGNCVDAVGSAWKASAPSLVHDGHARHGGPGSQPVLHLAPSTCILPSGTICVPLPVAFLADRACCDGA